MSTKTASQLWIGPIVCFLAIAVILRLWNLDVRSLAHPEIYIPGIDLPPGISEPPPRHDWLFSIWWHFHDEPHAMGYYLGMQIWTTIVGTSEFALRLPGVIMGTLSVFLVAALATKTYGRNVGVIVALLLTLHGFHIFWSQGARMYVPAAFVGLISTSILVHLSQLKVASWRWDLAYMVCALVGTLTFEFFWPFLFLHAAWVTVLLSTNRVLDDKKLSVGQFWRGTRLCQVQALAMLISAPTLLHAVYRARHAAPEANLNFLQDYFSFGFVLARDPIAIPALEPNIVSAVAALIACLCLVFYSFSKKAILPPPEIATNDMDCRSIPNWVRIGGAVVMAIFMIWLASIAHRRNAFLAAMALIPILTLALPGVMMLVAMVLRKLAWIKSIDPYQLLFVLLGVVPPIGIFVLSFVVPLLAPRAFLIFIPHLLVLCAAGLMALPVGRIVQSCVAAIVIAIFVQGLFQSYEKPGSPRDYKTLAQKMKLEMDKDDLVFVRSRHWADTPLFYYLPDANYVTEQYDMAIKQNPGCRSSRSA